MAGVIYKGDHARVIVPVTATYSIEATWGEPVDVPDALAASLLESGAWMKAGRKASKKAADPEAADNKNDEGKE